MRSRIVQIVKCTLRFKRKLKSARELLLFNFPKRGSRRGESSRKLENFIVDHRGKIIIDYSIKGEDVKLIKEAGLRLKVLRRPACNFRATGKS